MEAVNRSAPTLKAHSSAVVDQDSAAVEQPALTSTSVLRTMEAVSRSAPTLKAHSSAVVVQGSAAAEQPALTSTSAL